MSTDGDDLARVFRAESGRILASLMMDTRSIDLAEDAMAEAVLQATEQWPREGRPRNPPAWLLTVARRRLIDRLRRESLRSAEATLQAVHDTTPEPDEVAEADAPIPDERLRLIFVCCHPALAEDTRVPLTLKTLCGLSVKAIARAFLSSEIAMNQRLTRAKRKILDAGLAYEVPEGDALHERLRSVLAVVYLIYNESYNAYEGQTLSRDDLALEAIRLARLLHDLLPQPEVAGLLALLLLNHARAPARSSATQTFIPLQAQDRALWHTAQIREGTALVVTALGQGRPGAYQLQAAISALHAMAPSWEATDWPQIQGLYAQLYAIHPSPVVALNQAVASAYAGDTAGACARLDALESQLPHYQPFFAARAELCRQTGRWAHARKDYDRALALTQNNAERDFLLARRDGLPG